MAKCKVCDKKTNVVFNINLYAVHICEDCATSIFIQQAQWYVRQKYDSDSIIKKEIKKEE